MTNKHPQEPKTATAIKFNYPEDTIPRVVASGTDETAELIEQVAREHGVAVYKDPPLARALGLLEIGDAIPAALYQAVAEVLAFVYAVDQRYEEQRETLLEGASL